MIRFHRRFEPHSIQLLIFDLDGTLIDSRLDLVHSVNATLAHLGRPELPDELIASYVGDGAPALIRRTLGPDADNEALVRHGLEYFLTYYREHKLDYTHVYRGVEQALTAIQDSAKRPAAKDGCAFEQAGESVAGDCGGAWPGQIFRECLRGQ